MGAILLWPGCPTVSVSAGYEETESYSGDFGWVEYSMKQKEVVEILLGGI